MDKYMTRMDSERMVKFQEIIYLLKEDFWKPKKKMATLNTLLKQEKLPK